MRELSIEVRNEIVNLTKEGKTQKDIHEILGLSAQTIRKYQQKAGLLTVHPRDKGGRISKSILIAPANENAEVRQEDEEIFPVMIADQSLKIAGTESLNIYNVELMKDFVNVEGKNLIGEIKISDIPKIVDELRGVYNMALQMKSNRWELM